jgi:hypothetical protein
MKNWLRGFFYFYIFELRMALLSIPPRARTYHWSQDTFDIFSTYLSVDLGFSDMDITI